MNKLIKLSRLHFVHLNSKAGPFLVANFTEGIILLFSLCGYILAESLGNPHRMQFLMIFGSSIFCLFLTNLFFLLVKRGVTYVVVILLPYLILCVYHIQVMRLLSLAFVDSNRLFWILLLGSYSWFILNIIYQINIGLKYQGHSHFNEIVHGMSGVVAIPCMFVLLFSKLLQIPSQVSILIVSVLIICIHSVFVLAPIAAYSYWKDEQKVSATNYRYGRSLDLLDDE